MLRNPLFATVFVTLFLVIYHLFFQWGMPQDILSVLFILSPFLMIWMVVTILKHGKYNGAELKENEEWGYQDRQQTNIEQMNVEPKK
jgi:hypothetical protein